MPRRLEACWRLAWQQLRHQPLRLAVGAVGVAFAVALIFVQLGFQSAVYESATQYHRSLDYDLVLINPNTPFIGAPDGLARRRLYQARAHEAVVSVSALRIGRATWKNPWSRRTRDIIVLGVETTQPSFRADAIDRQRVKLQKEDAILFDGLSRPEFGPVPQHIAAKERVEVELNSRKVRVTGLVELGTSFGIDGTVITSETTFHQIFRQRKPSRIDLGLVRLRPGADAEAVRDAIASGLGEDVRVLTRDQFIARETEYWRSTTPVGYVTGFGCIMGLVVGLVIMYQILFADVSDHLAEYATLKAIGFSNRFLSGLVVSQAVILATLGFGVGTLASELLYWLAESSTRLPLTMTPDRFGLVLLVTMAMCGVAAWGTLHRVRASDPAEVFG